jgi:hypothetical protein
MSHTRTFSRLTEPYVLHTCWRILTVCVRVVVNEFTNRPGGILHKLRKDNHTWQDWERVACETKSKKICFLRSITTPSAHLSIPGLSICGNTLSVQDTRERESLRKRNKVDNRISPLHHARYLMASQWGIPVFCTTDDLIFILSLLWRASTSGPFPELHEPRIKALQFHV